VHWIVLFVLGVAVGGAVGLVFFGGLWWTTQRLTTSSHPGLLMSVSLLGRLGVLAVVMIVLARIDVALLVGAMAGLVATRIALTRAAARGRLPRQPAVDTTPEPGGRHGRS
jgi:F1F0 ATPase subunit 2